MKLLNFLKLSPQEKKLIQRVFVISLIACTIMVIAAWFIQRASLKKGPADIIQQKSPRADISALYNSKNKDLLPIDIEAHKIAAEEYKDAIPGKTIKHLLRVLAIEKKNRKIKLDLATAYLKSGLYNDAEKTFTALIEEKISDSLTDNIGARLGLTLFFTGRIEESIALLEKTLDNFPSSAEAYCYLGQIEAVQNITSKKAEGYLKKALEIHPNYTEAWYQLARYYMNRPNANDTDYYNARICLQKQTHIEPLNPKVHSRLGMVYFYLQKPYLAEKSYQTALALNENDYNTHYNLGELYYSLYNEPQKALEEFKKAILIKIDHMEANFKIGLISLENDMHKEAIQSFKKALEKAPGNIRVLLQLGVAYEKLSMKQEAVSVYQSILDLDALNDIALQKIKLLGSGK